MLRHNRAKNVIDARRIAGPIFPEPIQHIGVQPYGDKFFRRTPELSELFIGQRRDVGIIDRGNVRSPLPLGNGS